MQRLWIWVILLASLAGGIASWVPPARKVESIESARLGRLAVAYPMLLRPGEIGWAELKVAAQADAPGTAEAVIARLDLPGLAGAGNESGRVVSPKGEARFRWKLTGEQPGKYSGRLWVYTGSERELVLVREIFIEVRGAQMAWIWLARLGCPAAVLTTACIWARGRKPRRAGSR